jgi:hypothetical protein
MLGVIDKEVANLTRESVAPRRIQGKEFSQVHIGDLGLMRSEFPPFAGLFDRLWDFRHGNS